jgi:competence protein ComGC
MLFQRPTRRNAAAFTLVEALVLAGAVTLLVLVTFPVFARNDPLVRRAQCAGNLRQLTLAMLTWGVDNDNKQPQGLGGSWPWDFTRPAGDQITNYGAQRAQCYCPAFTNQNVDALWNFTPGYRVIGYSLTFPNTSIKTADQNPTFLP